MNGFYPDAPELDAGEGVVMSLDHFPPQVSSNVPVAAPPAEKADILSTDFG
jgi:hypothetical protein